MKNMLTEVSALDKISLNSFKYENFTAAIIERDFASLEALAEQIHESGKHTYQQADKIETILLNTKICLELDRKYNNIQSCFFYGRLNEVAEAYAAKSIQGVVEYFYPPKRILTPEEETQKQKGIKELLGIG